MTAHVAIESLSALLDGELSGAERGHVEEHVTACPACRTHLEELRAVADGLGGLDRPATPRTLDLTISSIARRSRGRLARLSLRPLTGALALPFAVVAALAVQLLVTHAGGLRRSADVPGSSETVRSAEPRPTVTGSGTPVLRFEAGAWRPASAAPDATDARPATADEWNRLRADEPGLARFAERHRLELLVGSEWIRFEPGEAPVEPLSAQPER